MGATLTAMADLKVTLGERVAAAVQQAAAAAGVDPATWVNDQLAKVLFLQTLTGVQQRNPEPLTEQAAQRVIYEP